TTEVTNLPLPHQRIQSRQSFFQRRVRIEAMDLVQINVIGLQAAQTQLDVLENMFTRETFSVRSHAGGKENLSGQYHVIAAAFQPFSQNFFRTSVGIAIGGVNEIAALIQIGAENCK